MEKKTSHDIVCSNGRKFPVSVSFSFPGTMGGVAVSVFPETISNSSSDCGVRIEDVCPVGRSPMRSS